MKSTIFTRTWWEAKEDSWYCFIMDWQLPDTALKQSLLWKLIQKGNLSLRLHNGICFSLCVLISLPSQQPWSSVGACSWWLDTFCIFPPETTRSTQMEERKTTLTSPSHWKPILHYLFEFLLIHRDKLKLWLLRKNACPKLSCLFYPVCSHSRLTWAYASQTCSLCLVIVFGVVETGLSKLLLPGSCVS